MSLIKVRNSDSSSKPILATSGAIQLCEKLELSINPFIDRHLSGDWGDICKDDWDANNEDVVAGGQIVSSYKLETGEKIWVISDPADESGQRQVTVLLPEDY